MVGGNEMINYNLFGGRGSAEAIRSTGYSTTANAIGEIVDNSIQAGASKVKIIVEVRRGYRTKTSERETQIIERIGIIDNGCGMDSETLRMALIFGEGTHFDEKHGLGKFGVGLPQASLSQGSVLKVWSWQDGIESAIYSGYDIYDDNWRAQGSQVPVPIKEEVPSEWAKHADSSKTGTLVLWSNLDRLSCTKANTLFEKSEMLIGRMYRRWINEKKVSIEYIVINPDSGEEIDCRQFKAVDPLFVMENTIVSDKDPPVDPMFEEMAPLSMNIPYKGDVYTITIRTSYAKKEIAKKVTKQDSAGRTSYGKIAGENIGLSIVREGRELKLDKNWTMTTNNNRDPRHRWWGAEIEFGRELDEVFGVTNDKQNATALSEAYNESFNEHRRIDPETGKRESIEDVKNRMSETEPKLYINIMVAEKIRELISNVVDKLPEMKAASDDSEKDTYSVEKESTERVKEQQSKGKIGYSDQGEKNTIEQRKEELKQALDHVGTPPAEIDEIVRNIITYDYKFYFVKDSKPSSDSFFEVRPDAGVLIIFLNTAHPLYGELFSSFDYMESGEKYSSDQLKDMLSDTYKAIKFMLTSWARMEDYSLKDNKRYAVRSREEWGKQARIMKGYDFDDDE